MRACPISAIVVALLVLAGCVGLPSTGGNGPSPDEFLNASDINPSVFDTHATELAYRSFTLSIERNRPDRNPPPVEENVTYINDTSWILVEPGTSQYLVHSNGYFSGNGTTYSNGSMEYVLFEGNRTTVRKLAPVSVFNESKEYYLWRGWFNNDSKGQLAFSAIDGIYERESVETF